MTAPKENSTKIKIESNEGKVPEALANMNFSTEQLPSLSEDEGRPASVEEVNGDGETTIPVEKQKEAFQLKVAKKEEKEEEEEKGEEKEEKEEKEEREEKEEKEEREEEEEKEEGIERFIKPPKGSEAEKKQTEKKGFDLSEFEPAEQDILKKMPKENIPVVMKLMRDAKEQSKIKENQFYQSPQGYLLHPGYQAEVNNIQLAEKEARVWSQALKDVKEGIAIKPLQGWNTKTGEPVFGAEVPSTPELEEAIRNNFNQCLAIASEKRKAVSSFVQNFPQLAAKDMGTIRAERTRRFAWVADSKLLDHTITTDAGEKSIKQVRSDTASLFPAYMRNNEAVEVCGDLMVALMVAKAELAESKKNEKVKVIKKGEEKAIEPSGDTRPKKTIQPVHGVKHFTTEGAGIEI